MVDMKPKRILTAGCCIAVAIAAGAYVMRAVIERVEDNALNPYRAQTAGELVVQYLETHNNEWPSGWDELAEDAIGHEDVQWIGDVREHVEVDFTFQLNAVDLSQELDRVRPPFRAVWLKNGRAISPEDGWEANTIIFRYLKRSSQLAISRSEQGDAR